MQKNLKETVARLKTLYRKKGENQIFARMVVSLPADIREDIKRRASQLCIESFPTLDHIFPLWEKHLAFFDALEDDWVPAIYPHPYDQGVYGAVFGAPLEINRVEGPGGASSMTKPFEDKTYEELQELVSSPDERWLKRLDNDLRYLADRSGGRWGVAVPITIDGLNFAMQIRGNQTMTDIYDCPDDLKALLQTAVGFNIRFVDRQHAAIGMELEGGVYDFFNAGWMPDKSIPMSIDCYNLCGPDVYAEFGLVYQQQLIDHFGGGNFHVHGNGRHLLGELAKLKGCVVASIGDDGNDIAAIDDLVEIKRRIGSITPVVSCGRHQFVRKLQERSLIGGIYYTVRGLDTIEEANRLMESVRSYAI